MQPFRREGMKMWAHLFSLVLLATITSCAADPSRAFQERRRAIETPIADYLYLDQLNAEDDDFEDWKEFKPSAPGALEFSLVWEAPQQLRGASICAHDKFYRVISCQRFEEAPPKETGILIEVEKDSYYIVVAIEEGHSVYEYRVKLHPHSNE